MRSHTGLGTMGTSIAAGILGAKDRSETVKRVIATVRAEQSKRRVEEALSAHSSRVTVLLQSENLRAIQEADVVLISVKHSQRAQIFAAGGVRQALREKKLLLCIMAGTPVENLHNEIFGESDRTPSQIIRAMPNMAAKIRKAVTLMTGNFDTLSEENLVLGKWIFDQVGESAVVVEGTFDIAAVMVGCAGSLLLVEIDGIRWQRESTGQKPKEWQWIVP
jgi:pyrroline-5-carboxylate reductase